MSVLNVAVPKAGTGVTFPVNTDELIGPTAVIPAHAVLEVLYQGLKVVLNRGQSKLLSSKGMSGKGLEENKAAILAAVQEQWEAFAKGEIRVTGGKPKEKKGDLDVEAMRLAKLYVKDALRKIGEKVSHYKAKEFTIAAQMLLSDEEQSAEIWAQAKENIERTESTKSKTTREQAEMFVAKVGVKKDPELVRKAEASKVAKRKTAVAAITAGRKGGPAAQGVTKH